MRWAFWRRRSGLPTAGPLDCAAVAAVLQEHLDNELDVDAASRVAAHLDACRACGLEAQTYAAIKTAVRNSQPVDDEAMSRLRDFADDLAGDGI